MTCRWEGVRVPGVAPEPVMLRASPWGYVHTAEEKSSIEDACHVLRAFWDCECCK